MNKKEKGLFIVLEGGECSGKTTVSKVLKKYFEETNKEVVLTFEPGATIKGRELRQKVLSKELPIEEQVKIFAEDRKIHLQEVILPALEEGKIVICDRYIYSSLVYQSFVGEVNQNFVFNANKGFKNPDYAFFLDIKPEIALSRLDNREDNNFFDKKNINFHQKIYNNYKSLNNKDLDKKYGLKKLIFIKASTDAENICKDIINTINKKER